MTTLDLALGAARRWTNYLGGRVEFKTERGVRHWRHVPAVHKGVEVTEAQADGLLAAQAQWERDNKDRNPRGYTQRLVRCGNVKRNVRPDPDSQPPGASILMGFAREMAEKVAEAIKGRK